MYNKVAPSGTYVSRLRDLKADDEYEPTMDHWFGVGEHCGSNEMVLQIAQLEPGQSTRAHYHVVADTGCYVLEGSCRITTWTKDGVEEERIIEREDFLYIPRGVPHRFANASTTEIFRLLGVYNCVGSGAKTEKYFTEPA